MDEFLVVVQPANLVELFLDEVFNRLYVVVGCVFNLLYTHCRSLVEVAVDVAQSFKQGAVEAFQLRQGQLAKRDEIFNFYTYAITDEGIL